MEKPQVLQLVADVLGVTPLSAQRMTLTHSGNTIYEVTLPEGSVIIRLRGADKDTLSHTLHNIQALAEIGLPTPVVLAADTSLTRYPFRYVILQKIPGRDLLYELPHMTPAQMTRLAERIVAYQRRVGTLPQGTGFGWGHVGEGGPEPVWFDVFRTDGERTPPLPDGTLLRDFTIRLHRQRVRFQPYFERIRPVCFLEDLTTKNVILQNGELQGLIDFDCVCFGDPLWMIGLAAACIVADIGTEPLFYIQELRRCWRLTERQNAVVTYYAAQRAIEFLKDAPAEKGEACAARLVSTIEQWLDWLEQI